jgi:ribose/xylose/arabinose/galactoside ABC-type transport system permease subunit
MSATTSQGPSMTSTSTSPSPSSASAPSRLGQLIPKDGTTVIRAVTALLFVLSLLFVPKFATQSNLRALLFSVALVGIAAVGLSLITIVGRLFSLAVSASIAVSTIVFASLLDHGPWVALAGAVLFGTVTGAVQGLLVGRFETDPIVTTIAAAAIITGIAQIQTGGRNVTGGSSDTVFDGTAFGIIPTQVFLFFVVTAVVWWLHKYTVVGRTLTLVGLNEGAARISGTRAWPVVTLAFAVTGCLAGVAGGLLASESGQGNLQLGATFGFDAITAVVVGGISVKGGHGSPLDAAVGAFLVGLLSNALILLGLDYQSQLMVKGLLVLLAVVVAGLTSGPSNGRKAGAR